jgi:Haem-binding domain
VNAHPVCTGIGSILGQFSNAFALAGFIFTKFELIMKKKILWIALGLFLAIQLIRPGMTNPPVTAAQDIQNVVNPPAEVMTMLRKTCYDCHSNETKWPWYSQIAPVSWWTANHVAEGREKLNFSTFGQLSVQDRSEALGEAAEAITEGEMPMSSYLWIHTEARLSPTEKQTLLTWLNANGEGEGGETEEH